MDKINVLQVCNQLGLGGTEKTLQVFAKYLNKDLFNVYICAIHRGGEREGMLKDMGLEVYVIDSNKKRLIDLMIGKNIHILHVHRAGVDEPLAIMAAQEARVPAIIETNVFGMVDRGEVGKLIDRHLMVSKMCALRYRSWSKMRDEEFGRKVNVVYNPVDMAEFENRDFSDEKLRQLRHELGIAPNDYVIGRIGRPDTAKWSGLCINMMTHLTREIPNVKYVIVGIPEAKISEIGKRGLASNFVFMETTSDPQKVSDFYKLIDVLAHSSRMGESFGCTIAEAMACRKPVVVNSTPLKDNAQIELVDNGKTGFIANYPKTFAEALTILLRNQDKAREMGLAGYAKVKREYEAKMVTRILEKIYVEVLQEKGVMTDDRIKTKYEDVKYNPSREDIDKFAQEYERRLFDCFGKVNRFEILAYRHLMWNPLILAMFKWRPT